MTFQNVRLKIVSPALKLQVAPKLTAAVSAQSPITLSTSGATYTIGLDATALETTLGGVYATLGANTFTDTQTINPPTGTTHQGVAITQTFPSTGSPVGPILGNKIDVINPGISATGSGWDAFGQQNLTYSARFTMSITGTTSGAGSSAFAAITNIAASTDGFGSASGVTITGASPAGHNAWGHIGYGIGFINSQIGVLIGSEGEVGVGTGGTVSYRIGVSANSQGPVKGSVLDAAFAASTITSHIPGSGTTSSPFEHLMALTGNLYGSSQFPITTTGDFLYSDVAGTVANGFNVANVIITGNALAFQNFTITGAGKANFGNGIAPDATLTVNNNTAASTALSVAVDAHLIAGDGLNGGVLSDNYGGETLFVGRAASGTQGAKTARVAASPYMALLGQIYDGSVYASNAALEFVTVNLQSGTDHSSRARLRLVPAASTTLTDVMLWGPGVAIGSGAADPGAGNLNLGGGDLQNNGTSPTGTGAYVRKTNPALITPDLGTPTAIVLTNATGTAASLTAGHVTTNANLTGDATSVGNATTVTKINGVDQTTAWTTYTPTVTSTGGTPTTVSAAGRYKQIGKTIFLQVVVTITTAGTATGQVFATLPTNAAAFDYAGSTYEKAITGKSGAAVITSGNSTRLQTSDATAATWWVSSYILVIGVTYEVP